MAVTTANTINFPPTHDDLFVYPRGGRYWIGPRAPANLIAGVTLSIKAGGLKVDSREVPGDEGAERTFLGYEDAEWDVVLTIWDLQGQYAEVKRITAIFRQWQKNIVISDKDVKKNYVPQPMRILHPALSRWGITAGYLFGVEENGYNSGEGLVITMRWREYQEEYKKTTKASGTDKMGKDGVAGPQPYEGTGFIETVNPQGQSNIDYDVPVPTQTKPLQFSGVTAPDGTQLIPDINTNNRTLFYQETQGGYKIPANFAPNKVIPSPGTTKPEPPFIPLPFLKGP